MHLCVCEREREWKKERKKKERKNESTKEDFLRSFRGMWDGHRFSTILDATLKTGLFFLFVPETGFIFMCNGEGGLQCPQLFGTFCRRKRLDFFAKGCHGRPGHPSLSKEKYILASPAMRFSDGTTLKFLFLSLLVERLPCFSRKELAQLCWEGQDCCQVKGCQPRFPLVLTPIAP